jgi:hypothetical protein
MEKKVEVKVVPFDSEVFQKEIETLFAKYEITNGAFCGTVSNSQYVAVIIRSGEKLTIENTFEATLNIGRLWQHARNAVRQDLNMFEKPKLDRW